MTIISLPIHCCCQFTSFEISDLLVHCCLCNTLIATCIVASCVYCLHLPTLTLGNFSSLLFHLLSCLWVLLVFHSLLLIFFLLSVILFLLGGDVSVLFVIIFLTLSISLSLLGFKPDVASTAGLLCLDRCVCYSNPPGRRPV